MLKEISINDNSTMTMFGGTIIFNKREIVSKPSITDYLRSGLKISFTIAIDYAKSNEWNEKDKKSLHYLDPNPDVLNEY